MLTGMRFFSEYD